jgi:16S rRNA (guanine527-N7)-methyltransferase
VPPESTAVDWSEIPAALHVSRESRAALEKYVEVLLVWQKRINLIGPSTVKQLWKRHILDSLQLLPLLPAGTRTIAELGSGAGIQGLVIAIAANLEAHLYESNGKKAAFLRAAIRQTGARAIVHQVRLETLGRQSEIPTVDAVVARAVAPLRLLLEYAEPFLATGAIGLFHKGQDVDAELTEATKYWNINFKLHSSMCDSHGVILEIRKATRV